MCGGIVGKALDVVGINPSTNAEKSAAKAQRAAEAKANAQAAEAEQKAASAANAQTQMARRALRQNSLLASESGGDTSTRSTLGV